MPTTTPDTFADSATSSVAGGAGGLGSLLNAADTSLLVQAGNGALFPTTGPFRVLLGTASGAYEIAICPAITTDTMTLVRGQEGTSAQTWGLGTPVQQVTTAGNMANLWKQGMAGGIAATLYGAKFDGTTNDSAALQLGIADAIAYNLPLILPAGTAILGAPLTVTAAVTILGAGREVTILKLANAVNDYAIKFTQTSGRIFGARFSDFSIEGNGLNQTADSGGIKAVGSVHGTFERLHMTHCWGWGLNFQQAPSSGPFAEHNHVSHCLFDNAVAAGYGGGVNFSGADENFITNCDFEFLGGITAPVGTLTIALLDQSGLQMITGCNFVGSRASTTQVIGIRCHFAHKTRIIGCTFDGVGGDSIWLACNDGVVLGNHFSSIGQQGPAGQSSGVHLEFGTARNTIVGNNLISDVTNGNTRSLIREESTGGSGRNLIAHNALYVNGTTTNGVIETAGADSQIRGNFGYNPLVTLPAPVAATLSNAGTGGTILAGTYQVEVTYVNAAGETIASASASTVTTGSTSTITITAPTPLGNAFGWYAYVTQAGGAIYTRQQAAGSPTPLGTNLVLTAPPSSGGANPPGANTTAGFSQPSVPASTVMQRNTMNVDCTVYVVGGTVTVIAVGGLTTGATSGPIRVPAGSSITLTYSAAPTWTWVGE